ARRGARVPFPAFPASSPTPPPFPRRGRPRTGLGGGAARAGTREPFVLDALDVYRLRSELLALHADEHDLRDVLPLVRARGLLPHGRVGEVELARQRAVVEDFAERLAAFAPGEAMGPLPVDLALGPVVLEGTLQGVAPHGQGRVPPGEGEARGSPLALDPPLGTPPGAPRRGRGGGGMAGHRKGAPFGVGGPPPGRAGPPGCVFPGGRPPPPAAFSRH